MIRLLSPGMMLLNRLRYPQKFLLISMLLVLPLILAIGLLLSETLPRIEFTNRELAGARYIEQLRNLIVLVDESHVLIDHGKSEQMLAHQPMITASLAALHDDLSLDGLFSTRSALLPIQELHQSIQKSIVRNDREAVDQGHLALVSALHDEIRRIGDASNLILDPELTTYYLMDTAVVQAPSRAVLLLNVDHTIDRPTASTNIGFELSVLAGQLEGNIEETRKGLQVALARDTTLDGEITAVLADSLTSATALTTALRATGQTGELNTEQAIGLSTNAFQSNMRLWRSSLVALNIRLQQRIDILWQKNLLASGAAIILLICVIYLLIAFYSSMMHTVAAVDQASRQLAAGTQSTEVQIETHDELGQVVASFNRIAGALVVESQERHAAELLRTQLQEQIIQSQADNLEALSVPIIPLGEHVLLLPLIGSIDTSRAQQVLETALHGVAARQTELLIVDMTGVRVVDSQVAQTIMQAVQGARLLGSSVVLAGIRAEVATTIVHLGVDLSMVEFYATLQDALDAYRLGAAHQ